MEPTFIDERRADPRSTEELITLALAAPDEEAEWKLLAVLHARGNREVLDAAGSLCTNFVAKERQLGAEILGQLGAPGSTYPEERFQLLATMLQHETDPDVLASIAVAFGHLEDPRCVRLLIPLKAHPNAGVRYSVVHGISGQDDPEAIETLIELSRDDDGNTRAWATFSLATFTEADSPAIREALLARVSDPKADARGEALVGLARRRDPAVIELLLKELTSASVGVEILEAAEELGDPKLLPALMQLKERYRSDASSNAALLSKAIARCCGISD